MGMGSVCVWKSERQNHFHTFTLSFSCNDLSFLSVVLSFQERRSWDVSSTPGSSQWLLRLLQEAAVLRYIHAYTIQVG